MPLHISRIITIISNFQGQDKKNEDKN